MQDLPTIDIIFPVRNRAWILSTFLEHIYEIDYPKDKITIIAMLNDSTDNSDLILYDFQKKYKDEYVDIIIKQKNLKIDNNYGLEDGTRGEKTFIKEEKTFFQIDLNSNSAWNVYRNLAKLRNLLLYLTNSDYAFSIDSDIMVKPNILNDLLKHKKDIISSLICNGYMFSKEDRYFFKNIMEEVKGAKYCHINPIGLRGLIEVDYTGAVYLISKKAAKSGAKYYDISEVLDGREAHYGEDAGFCWDLKHKYGFQLWCDTNCKSTHCMSKEWLDKYLDGKFVW
jgi:cellulose synthase/poly-beta-1,6-N-acetylglucosamine synthase-like glycosyltransferase